MLSRLFALERFWSKLPEDVGLLVSRLVLATLFWRSGQTKIAGFHVDLFDGKFELGWPSLADSTLFLFEYEYNLPLISPLVAALLAIVAEHLLPVLLLLGFMTRSAALLLLVMTAVIQIFVYPDAWITHGLWAGLLLQLMSRGAGRISIDARLH